MTLAYITILIFQLDPTIVSAVDDLAGGLFGEDLVEDDNKENEEELADVEIISNLPLKKDDNPRV